MDTSPIAAGVGDRAAAPEDPITSAQGIAPPAQNQLPGAHQAEFVICDQAIELAIKRLKSLLGLGALPAKSPALARVWLYAKLILALLA
ncbi:MAG: hypothetical protein JO046_06785, partial [Solirubrobacterales bacterium]|nr:hypothetical protein [Solirubrobacterales bacterium]